MTAFLGKGVDFGRDWRRVDGLSGLGGWVYVRAEARTLRLSC